MRNEGLFDDHTPNLLEVSIHIGNSVVVTRKLVVITIPNSFQESMVFFILSITSGSEEIFETGVHGPHNSIKGQCPHR